MEEVWEVFAIKYTDRNARTRKESFIFDDDHDSAHELDYFIWLLRAGDRVIVVDTGYDYTEAKRRNRPILRSPAEALAPLGVAADAVDTVIVTHMHYDHAGGLDLFPNAKFHLQESEMAYVTGACMCHDHLQFPFSAEHVCQMVRNVFSGRVIFHKGDGAVAPGVTVHRIGGHTDGLQVVRVKTAAGWMCLASDAAHYYENMQAGKPFPIVLNLADMLNGFTRIRGFVSSPSLIIPGHDPQVMTLFPATEGQADFIRRLDTGPTGPVPL